MKFEKHFNEEHQRAYYYCPQTEESVWELPPDAEVVDMTTTADESQQTAIQQYEAHKSKVEDLQAKTLEALYPEFYNQEPQPETHQQKCEDAELAQFKND